MERERPIDIVYCFLSCIVSVGLVDCSHIFASLGSVFVLCLLCPCFISCLVLMQISLDVWEGSVSIVARGVRRESESGEGETPLELSETPLLLFIDS